MGASPVLRWVLPVWVCVSLSVMFTSLLWQKSNGAGLNIFDATLSLPALFVLAPILFRRGLIESHTLLAASPLLIYIAYALISALWAENPDASKNFRGALQVLALFILFGYLSLTGRTDLLKRALMVACFCSAIVCAWHLFVMYGVLGAPWRDVLYTGVGGVALDEYGVKKINAMLATLLIAPQAALLFGLTIRERNFVLKIAGWVALTALVLYLVALERRTGQLAIIVALVACSVLYRRPFYYMILAAVLACGLLLVVYFPDFILSRGFSWRPQIWMSALGSIAEAPLFGHGLSNTVRPVDVLNDQGEVLQTFRHPHNMALSVAYAMGILGVLLWALLWVPGVLTRLRVPASEQNDGYIVLPLLVGLSALMFDGGEPLSTFHFNWFCFWVPVTLILARQASNARSMGNTRVWQRLFPRVASEIDGEPR